MSREDRIRRDERARVLSVLVSRQAEARTLFAQSENPKVREGLANRVVALTDAIREVRGS